MNEEIANNIYDWAVNESGIDWHGKSLLFLAVNYADYARMDSIWDGGDEPFWCSQNDSHAIDEAFGSAWNRLVQDGYADGVKC